MTTVQFKSYPGEWRPKRKNEPLHPISCPHTSPTLRCHGPSLRFQQPVLVLDLPKHWRMRPLTMPSTAMALVSADVLKDETPWEEALKSAVLRASQLWEVGSLNVEEVGESPKEMAQAGAMYDQNLPEVRDKRSLLEMANGWKSHIKGQVAQLADIHKRVRDTSPEHRRWHGILPKPTSASKTDAQWEDPSMWKSLPSPFVPHGIRHPLRSARVGFAVQWFRCGVACDDASRDPPALGDFGSSSQVPGWLRKRFWRWPGNGVVWQWSSPKSLGKKKAVAVASSNPLCRRRGRLD